MTIVGPEAVQPAIGAAPGAGVGADAPPPALAAARPPAGPAADVAALPAAGDAAVALPAAARLEDAAMDGLGALAAAPAAPDWGEAADAVPDAGADEPSSAGSWAAPDAGTAGAPGAGAPDDSLALSSPRRSLLDVRAPQPLATSRASRPTHSGADRRNNRFPMSPPDDTAVPRLNGPEHFLEAGHGVLVAADPAALVAEHPQQQLRRRQLQGGLRAL